jgi:hypothetical protein
LKKSTVPGMMCLCKTVQQSRWTRRNNFARIRRVPQEAKWERATFVFTRISHNGITVTGVRRPLAHDEAMMEGLRTPAEVVLRVIILLAYGCPTQAIVHAYGSDAP